MARRSAEISKPIASKSAAHRASDRFLAGLTDSPRVTFVSHVQPDPDSLGSMLGLSHLVNTRLRIPTRITRDGLICRAENQEMVRALDIELTPIEGITAMPHEAVVMVDSQPHTGRHSFNGELPLYAVIDHHTTPGDVRGVPFVDLRPTLGATCTLVTRYLIEQNVPLSPRVATALYYGIETEVSGYPREATEADDSALHFLFPLVDKTALARIRNAKLPHSHFAVLLQALQNSTLYDRLLISWIDNLSQPEQAAQIVDYLVRLDQVDWALCGGICNGTLILSMRTSLQGVQAGDLLRHVVGKFGKAGGHDRRAGGAISVQKRSPNDLRHLKDELKKRLLSALNIADQQGHPLVPIPTLSH